VTGHGVLAFATASVLAACVVLVATIVLVRGVRLSGMRRDERLLAPLRSSLIQVAAGEDADGRATRQLASATGARAAALDTRIIALLGKVRGTPTDQLVQVLQTHGAVQRAHRDLVRRSPVRRARAAQVLGLTRAHDARALLETALRDRHLEVRASAAFALGLLGEPESAAPLLAAVAGTDPRRAGVVGVPAGAASEALLSMGVGISAALEEGMRHDHPRTRTVAAHVSGLHSVTRGLDVLRELLEHDPDIVVREVAATAIGQIGRRSEDVAVLARLTGSEVAPSLRRACVAALGELRLPEAVPVLSALVVDDDERLRELAATALLRLGPEGRLALAPHTDTTAVQAATLFATLQGASR
jgi:HEAT repeat protein